MLGPAADQAQVSVFLEANSSGGVTESGSNILKRSGPRSPVDPAASLFDRQYFPSGRWPRRFVVVDRHSPCKALAVGFFSYSDSSVVVEHTALESFGVAPLASNSKKKSFS